MNLLTIVDLDCITIIEKKTFHLYTLPSKFFNYAMKI